MTGPYLRTDPASRQSEIEHLVPKLVPCVSVRDCGTEYRDCSSKIKMPKRAGSVGKQNIEAGQKERGSGQKEHFVAGKTLAKKKYIMLAASPGQGFDPVGTACSAGPWVAGEQGVWTEPAR